VVPTRRCHPRVAIKHMDGRDAETLKAYYDELGDERAARLGGGLTRSGQRVREGDGGRVPAPLSASIPVGTDDDAGPSGPHGERMRFWLRESPDDVVRCVCGATEGILAEEGRVPLRHRSVMSLPVASENDDAVVRGRTVTDERELE
jgi:hypothetical protein